MKTRLLAPLAATAFATLVALAAEPPAATLSQLEKALSRSDPETLGRPARATVHAVVSKPNGKAREEYLMETVVHADGTREEKLIRAKKDGRDVTAEKLAEGKNRRKRRAAGDEPQGAPRAGGKKEPGSGKAALGLKFPTGEDRRLFVMGGPKTEGRFLVVAFEPAPGLKDENLSRGRIGWNAASGEPAFIEAELVDPPTGLQELHVRGEFAGEGDAIYTSLLKTSGVGGILWIKRRFEITVELKDLTPAAP